MSLLVWLIFVVAALLEVSGDAIIREGLRGWRPLYIVAGCVVLGCYGVVVNVVRWDFSKLLGVYVALFALTSIMYGRFVFQESIPMSTWVGATCIVVGGLVMQCGTR